MQPHIRHEWPSRIPDALALERELSCHIDVTPASLPPRTIAAVESAYGSGATYLYAAVTLLTYPDLIEISHHCLRKEVVFPYVPGLFYFREGPALVEVLSNLNAPPDVVLVHGHGIAHPRRCGMASLIGVVFDLPTIGCSRRLLAGQHEPVPPDKGCQEPIRIDGETVGSAVRTRQDVKPLFVSPGHRYALIDACRLVLETSREYRLPEPLRMAHGLAHRYKRYTEDRKRGRFRERK